LSNRIISTVCVPNFPNFGLVGDHLQFVNLFAFPFVSSARFIPKIYPLNRYVVAKTPEIGRFGAPHTLHIDTTCLTTCFALLIFLARNIIND